MRPASLSMLLLMLGCLAGCQRTVFERAPAAAGCDPALAGQWRAQDDDDKARAMLQINHDCTLRVGERSGHDLRDGARGALATAHVGDRRLVWIAADQVRRDFEHFDPSAIERDGDWFVFEYRVDGDALTAWPPAHKAIAHAIIDERYEGEVLRGQNLLVNRITGDPAPALTGADFFDRDAAIRFLRVATAHP